MINTRTKYLRIEEMTDKNSNNIEKMNRHNNSVGNNIINDGFSSYNYLIAEIVTITI